MGNNPLLSIIIPAYNEEKRICKCLRSAISSSYKEIEIIVVDDGSSDDTFGVCKEFASANMDVPISIVTSEHLGIFEARKKGVSEAKGKYLTFLDADDWIDSNTYSEVMNICVENDIDVLAYTYNGEGINNFTINHLYDEGIYDRKKIVDYIIPTMMFDERYNRRRLDPSLCCKVMKKECYLFISNMVTSRVSIGEDALISYPLISIAEKIHIMNKPFYHYQQRQSSCSKTWDADKIDDLEKFYKEIKHVFNKLQMMEVMAEQIDNYMRMYISDFSVMRFGISMNLEKYSFPYYLFQPEDSVVIYGAGDVGDSYLHSMVRVNYIKISGWLDKNYSNKKYVCGMKPSSPADFVFDNKDKILIAAKTEKTVAEIKADLLELRVDADSIYWVKPIISHHI